jgi:hypothetical protein
MSQAAREEFLEKFTQPSVRRKELFDLLAAMGDRVVREVVRVWLGGSTRTEAELVAKIRITFPVGVLAGARLNPAEVVGLVMGAEGDLDGRP